MSINQPAVYEDVPIPVEDPGTRCTPFGGRGVTLPRGVGRQPCDRPPAPEGAGVGGGASRLVSCKSITYTPTISPFLIAKDALIDMMSFPVSHPSRKYDMVCQGFVEYLDQCEQKGFFVKGYDTKAGEMINHSMAYANRWGPTRRRKLAEKLDRLEYWFELQQDRPVTMITLTSYHKGESIESAWIKLNESRGKLLKLISKYFDKPDYFWVPEPHKSGYVHYHLAVFAQIDNYTRDTSNHVGWVRCRTRQDEDIWEIANGKGIEDKFREIWEKKYKTGNHTYGLDFSQKKGDGKIQHLKNYLSKYLAKGFLLDKWSTGMLLFNAHLWETGYRMYGASKNIRKIMNIREEKNSDVVWLETRLQTVEITPENEEVEIDRVIWHRQYIPDWIDAGLWIHAGKLKTGDPEPLYWHKWGRETIEDRYHDLPPTSYLDGRAARKRERDGYL